MSVQQHENVLFTKNIQHLFKDEQQQQQYAKACYCLFRLDEKAEIRLNVNGHVVFIQRSDIVIQ